MNNECLDCSSHLIERATWPKVYIRLGLGLGQA